MQSHYKDALIQIIDFLENLEKSQGVKYYLVGGILPFIKKSIRIIIK